MRRRRPPGGREARSMKYLLAVGAIAVLIMATGCIPAVAQAGPETDAAGSVELYEDMLDAGLITREEYERLVATGYCAGAGATGITEGTANDDNAPNPREFRKLRYKDRKTVQAAKLAALAGKLREKQVARRKRAEEKAGSLGMPVRQVFQDGREVELQALEDGRAPEYYITANTVSADTISTDEVRPGAANSYGLSGNTVRIGMWDSGAVRNTHQELVQRIIQKDVPPGPSAHSTAVAGTIAASGVQPAARGMAYCALLDAYCWDSDFAEMAEAAGGELRISNHSYSYATGWWSNSAESTWYWWGDVAKSQAEDLNFGRYRDHTRDVDDIVYNALYYLPVWSAGNDRTDVPVSQPVVHKAWAGYWMSTSTVRPADGGSEGYDSIGSLGVAKNILTVGAVNDIPGGYTTPAGVEMTAFSGFGPTDDGRIKPDVVANGVSLYTTKNLNDASYSWYTGTSFSAPSVAGSLGLLQELHEDLHGTNGPLLASSMKGLLIHTADEAGNYNGPDYRFGWGLVNTLKAARLIAENAAWNSRPHLKEVALNNGDFIEFAVLAQAGKPLKVTICWSDPPGEEHPYSLDPTNIVLVNDLDLRVYGPDGQTNMPWVPNPAYPSLAAIKGDNFRDNVEQVSIPAPLEGFHTVRVTHKRSLQGGFQDVSILVSGNVASNENLAITDTGLSPGGRNRIEWSGTVGSIHYVVTRADLAGTNTWEETSDDISVSRRKMSWVDTVNEDEGARFYRIRQTK